MPMSMLVKVEEELAQPSSVASSESEMLTSAIACSFAIEPRRKRKRAIDWAAELQGDDIVVENHKKDIRLKVVKKNDEIFGVKCASCGRFIKTTNRMNFNGDFYRHISECAIHHGLVYNVEKFEKDSFAEILTEIQAKDLETFFNLTTPAKKKLYGFLIEFGYNVCKKVSYCPVPKPDELFYNQNILRQNLQLNVEKEFPKIKEKIGNWFKNNSGCFAIDFTTKEKHFYGIVGHILDNEWKLRV